MLWISFLCTNIPSVAPCCLHICDSCTRIAQEKSGERYPNRVVSFGLNRVYIKIRTPNSPCTDNTWLFEYFYGFFGFVVWEISGHFWGVYLSHYCASAVAFLFSFVYFIFLNIASYLYGKQIKSKLWTVLYLWMIFIYVRLNRLHLHECHSMLLKTPAELQGLGGELAPRCTTCKARPIGEWICPGVCKPSPQLWVK